MDFCGKIFVITGASSGIGAALARVVDGAGGSVVLGARSLDKIEALAAELKSAIAVKCDVGLESECKMLIEAAVAAFGGVDVLINNAGISMRAIFDEVELDVLHRLMDTNFWGTVYCTKYALPYLLSSKGSVVGVSSVAGIHGLPARSGYSASKFAMVGFLETIRVENLRTGLHVMVAYPGFTESNVRFAALTSDGSAQGASPRAEGKMASAEQVAHRILKGIAKRKIELVMDFDGRASKILRLFAPRLTDRLYFKHMAAEPDSPLIKKL